MLEVDATALSRGAGRQMCPLDMLNFWMSTVMSAAVMPDLLAGEFVKAVIAAPRSLVPAVGVIMLDPIIPPIVIDIWLPLFLPSMIPSEASFIIAVTIADEFVMFRCFAYCDIAASVMP